MRISINELTTYGWSFREDVHQYVASGIPAMGVWRQKLADFGDEKGVRLLVESGIAVSNLFWAGGFTGTDGRSFSDSLDDALEAIQLANCMDASCLVFFTGSQGGHTSNHAWRLAKEAFVELSQVAEALQVTLAVEPMHVNCANKWTFMTELEDAHRMIDQVRSEQLKLVFDTFHFGHVDLQRLEAMVDRIALVYLGDRREPPSHEQNRCLLGDGEVPLSEIVGALTAGGYEGYFDVKLRGRDVEQHTYDDILKHSKSVIDRIAAVVSK